MNVTTIPVGTTGQSLEGVAVSTGVRESVILTSPTDPNGFAEIVSTQPIGFYGLPVWLQGTPSVSVAALPAISGSVSSQIVSSIPFYVSQSSAPWTMNGGIAVTNTPTVNVTNVPLVTVQGTSSVNVLNAPTVNVTNVPLVTVQGTSSVNVISSAPHAISGTVSTQVVSSIPFFVAQSSAPWTMNGALAVTNSPNVNVTNVPAVNITSSIPFFVAQSSAPWSMTGTTTPNIVSSIPFFVSQSSAPWSFVETVSTAGGMSAITIALAATLNTTVVKASAGQLYGILGANIGSSNVFVRLYNVSTAATLIASSGVPLVVWGMQTSTSPYNNYDAGIPFGAGIGLITQQQSYTASSSVAPTASTATITLLFK